MIVRIGVRESPKELEVDIADSTERAALKAQIEAAIAGEPSMLWLADRHGREVGVPTDRIAYVDLGEPGSGPRIGFGA